MAGRPRLRIGQHGKITRHDLGGGVWLAHCRVRDADGVVRRAERRTPKGERDQHGKVAERELLDHLEDRRTPSDGEVSEKTTLKKLFELYMDRLEEAGRATRTLDTYRYVITKLEQRAGEVTVREATPGRIDAVIRGMHTDHGTTMARQSKTILKGALALAVLAGALDTNPVHNVSRIESKAPPKGAPAVTADELARLLAALEASDACRKADIADPIVMLAATGLRRGELLALRWRDVDIKAGTVTVAGKVVRVKGEGLRRFDEAKTAAGLRTIALPKFAIDMLKRRAKQPRLGTLGVIFPSTAGTLRDPDNFSGQWRKVRDELKLPDVTSHSFRKTVATLIEADGQTARVGADHLGQRSLSVYQDRYVDRGRTHAAVASMLDRAVAINVE